MKLRMCFIAQVANSVLNPTFVSRSLAPTIHLAAKRHSSFKAAVLKEMGKPLEIKDVKAVKRLGANDVRINVFACGVSYSDILICKGEYGYLPKLPFVPGFQASGEVLEVGPLVKNFHAGDRVVCSNKAHNGCFAEQCVTPAQDVWNIPSHITFEVAVTLIDSYATAYLAFARRVVTEPDDIVLVTAASGGLGLAAVDIAANVFKAKVIGVTGTEDKADLVRHKGAWAALTYKKKAVVSKVMEVSNNKGAKIIFEAIGGDIFKEMLECVAHEGCAIVAGFASRSIPHIPATLLLPQSCSVIGISLTHYRETAPDVYNEIMEAVIKLAEEKFISPHISAKFSLEEVNKAFKFIQDKKATGSVVINVR